MENYQYIGFIPIDKSWTIRMGVLDLLNEKPDTLQLLEKAPDLSTDLRSLVRASRDWMQPQQPIHVGESGTLYRFLLFASWKLGVEKTFFLEKTLRHRKITLNPEIVTWPIAELLKLDNETSQWASAAVLWEKDIAPLPNPPSKLALTYEAVRHWRERRKEGECWNIRLDLTIQKQMEAFVGALEGKGLRFQPLHSEDYCFARAFDLVSPEEGRVDWPSLQGHESNRIEEMERALSELATGIPVSSRDHRIVQAIAMKQKLEKKERVGLLKHPRCVSKSWPLFWEFMRQI